jgi:hypothetical protein
VHRNRWGLEPTLHSFNSQAVGLPLISCLTLNLQYIRSNSSSTSALHWVERRSKCGLIFCIYWFIFYSEVYPLQGFVERNFQGDLLARRHFTYSVTFTCLFTIFKLMYKYFAREAEFLSFLSWRFFWVQVLEGNYMQVLEGNYMQVLEGNYVSYVHVHDVKLYLICTLPWRLLWFSYNPCQT